MKPIGFAGRKPPHVGHRIENAGYSGAYVPEISFPHICVLENQQSQETPKHLPVNTVNKVEHVKDVLRPVRPCAEFEQALPLVEKAYKYDSKNKNALKILSNIYTALERPEDAEKIKAAGYDIRHSAEMLEDIYMKNKAFR